MDITIVACILHALGRFRMYSRELCTTSLRLQVPRSCNRRVPHVEALQKQWGNAPVNSESCCPADASGNCPEDALQAADGIQPNLQADTKGDARWVEVPGEARIGHDWGSTQLEASVLEPIAKVGSVPFPCDSSEVRLVWSS